MLVKFLVDEKILELLFSEIVLIVLLLGEVIFEYLVVLVVFIFIIFDW